MSFDQASDEETFMPNEVDRLKAQIKQIKQRLDSATSRKRQLRRELLEEDLAYLTVTRLTQLIQDPTRVAEFELNQMQKQIFDKLMITLEDCCRREVVSYHRLAGRSIFQFKGSRSCIRLETFYGNTYREPFYLIYDKHKGESIQHHTIPPFIHLDNLQAQFIPHNFNTFIRIVHHQVQAYVSRREATNEVIQMSTQYAVKPIYRTDSIDQFDFRITSPNIGTLFVSTIFRDKSSTFPTSVSIKALGNDSTINENQRDRHFAQIEHSLKRKRMKDVVMALVDSSFQSDDFT
ncbi:uncharacterized protein B0P05DRAFT_534373 [Gilbertella persicaria]|uniref:uncharacterized protein n=1 Tax=Gilbertella persicaria TaxID=101096 RepID=UPI00221EC7CB|nr:uncharacterized protein B0P05DRAFT_534373 [Gilbertella persicaria]KAI8085959.1 hypothetical protein B0P05DRAFT_534373 [Gilbertella persicaria]